MRYATTALLVAALGGLTISNTPSPHHYSYVGYQCTTKGSGQLLALGGASLGTLSNADFAAGSSCTVIPPTGTPASIALRCEVSAGSAAILASTPAAATAPAGEWCIEVRTVAAQ